MSLKTEIIPALDKNGIVEAATIAKAAALLRASEVVAFPTETVYGLGANALDAAAIARIYKAKGRPASNPLIVHVANLDQARELTVEWPDAADKLARAFWPGPLTIVLKKRNIVPDIVTAGGDTVAVRCPDHPVALALIQACGFPVAAPSANRSNYISPTTAQHVIKSLDGRIPLVLDGGPCQAGIESTVVSLAEGKAKILRPGSVTREMIQLRLNIEVAGHEMILENGGKLLSPGQLPRHYSPNTPVMLVPREELQVDAARQRSQGKKVICIELPQDPADFAKDIYAVLHEADAAKADLIIIEAPPDSPEWIAIADRLRRAAN